MGELSWGDRGHRGAGVGCWWTLWGKRGEGKLKCALLYTVTEKATTVLPLGCLQAGYTCVTPLPCPWGVHRLVYTPAAATSSGTHN